MEDLTNFCVRQRLPWVISITDIVEYFVFLELVHVLEFADQDVAKSVHLAAHHSSGLLEHLVELLFMTDLSLVYVSDAFDQLCVRRIKVCFSGLVYTHLHIDREAHLGEFHLHFI